METQDSEENLLVHEELTTYAKEEMGTKSDETKILGIPWQKRKDELAISFSKCIERRKDGLLTKRKMLSTINGIFDPLGIFDPFTSHHHCQDTL